jgi:RNA polymerase sigma-70 factor (ECF subfamily)
MTPPVDRNKIDRLVVEHLPAALRMALRLTGDSHVAEDLVQETLLRVLRQWRSYRGEASFKTWLLQILVNADRDRRRRLRVYEPIEANELAGDADQSVDLAGAAELGADVRAAVDALPERQREVALLLWGEGLAAGEAANVLGITEANVYSCLHLARKRVAQAIGVDRENLKRR